MKISKWTGPIDFIWISWSYFYRKCSWNIHIKFMKISWLVLLWNKHENIQMNCSHWFHMNIMIIFLPKGFMKHSYQIHEIFMNIFLLKSSWKCPNELLSLISFEYHHHIFTDRSHETFMSNSCKFHEYFYYEISMKMSK